MKFDHVGFRSYIQREDEFYYEPNKVWITDSQKHPFNVEWLRYEEDSPVLEPVKSQPHIGYVVDDIDEAMEGMKLLFGPVWIDDHKRIAFCLSEDDVVIEFMENR